MRLPSSILDYLTVLDTFIAREIAPLQASNDNERFFDHRREWARTDWDNGGLPDRSWEALLVEMRRRADAAGHLRFALPKEFGGQDGSHLAMAAIREHLAAKGLGLHNDLQNESSIVGNNPLALMVRDFGTDQQKRDWLPQLLDGTMRIAFGLTEPAHGSDATHMETTAVRATVNGVQGWVINGEKMWNTGIHHATHDLVFARNDGQSGQAHGITAFVVPVPSDGFTIEEYMWTLNMPTDHARISLNNVFVPEDAHLSDVSRGLAVAMHFVHENRIRQAASSLGAAVYCIRESVEWAKQRVTFGKPLAVNQAIQFPLVELHTEATMLRQLIYHAADSMDHMSKPEIADKLTDLVSMCNYRANRLVCDAADRAMQIHGGMGYSRHKPFEHIFRHHRRYRITEGSEEIQMRRIARELFGGFRR